MTETSPQRFNVLAQWGPRAEDARAVATRTAATLVMLRELGGAWRAPLSSDGIVVDDADVEAAVRAQPLTNDAGDDLSHLGYQPAFTLGELSEATTAPDHAALKITSSSISTTSGVPVSSALLVAQGARYVEPLLAHALTVTATMGDTWGASAASLRDMPLMRAEATAPRHVGFPVWGYVAWLADTVFDATAPVAGASVTCVGEGALLVVNDRTTEATVKVWGELLRSGRLGRIA